MSTQKARFRASVLLSTYVKDISSTNHEMKNGHKIEFTYLEHMELRYENRFCLFLFGELD